MQKRIKDINEKIKKGEAVIVGADEMPELYEENPKRAFREVDVVTTATFGAMCSSGAFLNLGHSDPPIKMQKVWLNDVEACTGIAAVDLYIGATQLSESKGFEYGGAHVIEDLIAGKEIEVRAESYGTDCYPRKKLKTTVTIDDLNQAIMVNPRNAYQRYKAATNSSDMKLRTYMGTLLPRYGNVNFAGCGEISPLANDPSYKTIGIGTRIFIGGSIGYVIGEGTQHNPKEQMGTISVRGDMKNMSTEYVKAATIPGYGVTLFVGIGIPIPILDEELAKSTAVRNSDLKTEILDYGVPRLNKPVVARVSYEELFSGKVEIKGKKVKTGSLSSLKIAKQIMDELKIWIEDKEFYLSEPVERLSRDVTYKPMRMEKKIIRVIDIMTREVIVASPEQSIEEVSEILVKNHIDQVPVTIENMELRGIVTSRDIIKGIAEKKKRIRDIMTKKVIVSFADEPIDVVVRRMNKYKIDATPVIDENGKVIGIITISDIMRKGYREESS